MASRLHKNAFSETFIYIKAGQFAWSCKLSCFGSGILKVVISIPIFKYKDSGNDTGTDFCNSNCEPDSIKAKNDWQEQYGCHLEYEGS